MDNIEILNKVQDHIVELYEDCKNLPGFEETGKNWDVVMACLINIQTVIFRLEDGEDLRFNFDKNKRLSPDIRQKLNSYINSTKN